MVRLFVFLGLLTCFVSCSKDNGTPPPDEIPRILNGVIGEFNLMPHDINTPEKGMFLISANSTIYKVDFNVVSESASNAYLLFDTDTILTDQSREVGFLGNDQVAYNPVAANQILVVFSDDRKITGFFDINTSFGGVFGESLINQWRDPTDPAKPNEKAKSDIMNLVQKYSDKDGAGPETKPEPLYVTITKR